MTPYLQQLILHGALDSVEDQKWLSKDSVAASYLKVQQLTLTRVHAVATIEQQYSSETRLACEIVSRKTKIVACRACAL